MSFRDDSSEIQCHATLRLSGESVDPVAVSETLEIQPSATSEQETGDGGLWTMTSRGQVDSASLDAHIHWIIEQLEPSANRFTRLGNARGTDVVMDCVFTTSADHGGPLVDASILRRLGDLHIDLALDVHAGTS